MDIINSIAKQILPQDGQAKDSVRARSAIITIIIVDFCAIVWTVIYYQLGYPLASLAPLNYFTLSMFLFLVALFARKYEMFIQMHIILIILLPWAMHVFLGDIFNSSMVIIWGVMGPIFAVFFSKHTKIVFFWLGFYLTLVMSTYFFQTELYYFSKSIGGGNSPYTLGILINFFGVLFVIILLMVITRMTTFKYQQQVEEILLSLFPYPVVQNMLQEKGKKFETFVQKSQATIIFIQIMVKKSFDNSLDQSKKVADLLNYFFKELDKFIEKLEANKIKTHSEIYIASSGLFQPENIYQMIELGKEALKLVKNYNQSQKKNILQVKIGINSGPLVVGIIGKSKRIFDMWGDTVNIASRMSMTKYTNKIVITEHIYQQLTDKRQATKHKYIPVKGKGMMTIYSLS